MSTSRRAAYADATRVAIIDAARTLFARQGYFATKVDQIAELAQVAAGTVYVAGGKQGLLHLLVEEWAQAPVVQDSRDRLAALENPDEILHLLAAATRSSRAEHGDIMRILLNTAPHEATAAAALEQSTERYRASMRLVAERLEALGALRKGTTVPRATDVLWFYFGYSGFFSLTDNGWSLDQAQEWLREQAAAALLKPADGR